MALGALTRRISARGRWPGRKWEMAIRGLQLARYRADAWRARGPEGYTPSILPCHDELERTVQDCTMQPPARSSASTSRSIQRRPLASAADGGMRRPQSGGMLPRHRVIAPRARNTKRRLERVRGGMSPRYSVAHCWTSAYKAGRSVPPLDSRRLLLSTALLLVGRRPPAGPLPLGLASRVSIRIRAGGDPLVRTRRGAAGRGVSSRQAPAGDYQPRRTSGPRHHGSALRALSHLPVCTLPIRNAADNDAAVSPPRPRAGQYRPAPLLHGRADDLIA